MLDGAEAGTLQAVSAAMPLVDARLVLWLSPTFPVGAYAYSHGLEWAAQKGWVRNRATLTAWLGELLAHGSARNDLILLAQSAAALRAGRLAGLAEINALALALQPSAERYLETQQQGSSFLTAMTAAWDAPLLAPARQAVGEHVAYPVAVGIAVAAHGMTTGGALAAYAMAFTANLVSAAIRLSVIGQTDAQRVLADLLPLAIRAASLAEAATLDDLGSSAFRSDIASLAHETQYTRLFRS
ncbi:MAG: urease accessory protein UreF [Hyphomicrobiaceae bacterium]